MSHRLFKTSQSFHSYIEKKLLRSQWKRVNLKRLINTLNRVDFQDGTIIVSLKHPKYNKVHYLPARPKPTIDSNLDCLWAEDAEFPADLQSYQFINFYLTDGLHLILAEALFQDMCENGIRLTLPEISYEISSRQIRRHPGDDVEVQLVQSGFSYQGRMLDYSSFAFAVDLSAVSVKQFELINPIAGIDVVVKKGKQVIYSGPCRVVRRAAAEQALLLVLEPVISEIQRYEPKRFRSVRQQLTPSPNVIFTHPCTGKKVSLSTIDLSGSGFSVQEDAGNSILLPGMILPEVNIEFAKNLQINCCSQVIFSQKDEGREDVKSGLVILDMTPSEHIRLASLLYQAEDSKSYLCSNNINLDELWNFFFDTGFIYPEKYKLIQNYKEKFKDLYKKLYTESPEIARHVTYQDNGVIHGHVSMFRFFSNTWLLHHHAAKRTKYKKAGLIVMENILRYVNEFHKLSSSCMKYIACYYRPRNKFANRVFGDAGRSLNDPRKSSVDSFAYFYFKKDGESRELPSSWQIGEASPVELAELVDFYEHESGGLMLESMDLGRLLVDKGDDVGELYKKLGFKRHCRHLSLRHRGRLKAVLLVHVSDFGLNMSELSNCIKIIIVDDKGLDREILYGAFRQAAVYYEESDIPVLLYPVAIADIVKLKWDKQYDLVVLDLDHLDPYLQYIDKLLHPPSREKITKLRTEQIPD